MRDVETGDDPAPALGGAEAYPGRTHKRYNEFEPFVVRSFWDSPPISSLLHEGSRELGYPLETWETIFRREAPSPQHWERLRTLLEELREQGRAVDPHLFAQILGFGSFLPRVGRRHPELLAPQVLPLLHRGEELLPWVQEQYRGLPLRKRLRCERQATLALLVAAQNLGILPAQEVCRLYSLFAERWIHLAALHSYERCKEECGATPRNGAGVPVPYCILACGKLGSQELNMSSDVDLIFLVEEQGELPGEGKKGKTLLAPEFWDRWARGVIELLETPEEEGFVLRVDVRLRPGGNQSPLVITSSHFLDYYRQYSSALERLVLLRARPVAGELSLGGRMLHLLEPILFPRHLDFEVLDEIRWLKGKIDREAARARKRGTEIKLGPGGIRELEFLLHTLAMVYGGKHKELRCGNTLALLRGLSRLGLISEATALRLRSAYIFLRGVENLIQAREDLQTHTLPQDPPALEELARSLGYRGKEAGTRFLRDLELHRKGVEEEFRALFYESREGGEKIAPEIHDLLETEDLEEKEQLLARLSFADPRQALAHLERLRTGLRPTIYGTKTRNQFERILPSLLFEVVRSEDPDQALRWLRAFVDRVGGRPYIYALLRENPEVARSLIRLFAASELLGSYLCEHPELMDTLVLRSYAIPYRAPEKTEEELDRLMASHPEPWEFAEELRSFKNLELLRIALNDLSGAIHPLEVMEQLTVLARELVKRLLLKSRELLKARPGNELYPVALGKLGSGEMMYGSDLDLLFILSPEAEEGLEAYVPWAQKLITLLSTRTPRGVLYAVDLRLRPSGNQGLLVSTFAAFQEYHRRLASIWERVALVYHEVVHPHPDPRIREFLLHACYGAPLRKEDLTKMKEIREKMEVERGRSDPLKAGKGGVAEIEFSLALLAIQAVQEGRMNPRANPWEILAALERAYPELEGILPALRKGLWFYRVLMNRLRLVTGQSTNAVPADPRSFRKLATSLGAEEGELREWLRVVPLEVRAAWERVLEFLFHRCLWG